MEFIAYDDGVLRDKRYRSVDVVEEPLQKNLKGIRRQRKLDYGLSLVHQPEQPKGEGLFTVDPRIVEFRDVCVGEKCTKAITLTNCTNKSRTFRVLPISPMFSRVLRLQYDLPPKLPPGLSWSINVVFTPLKEDDMETVIAFRTEDGVFLVPVRFFRKRVALSISPERLDFGCVVFGEKVTKRITLKNDGGLNAGVFVSGSLREWMEVFHNNSYQGDVPVVRINPATNYVTVPPYSISFLDVTFSPHEGVVLNDDIELRYEVDGLPTVKKVVVKGSGDSLPVYVSSGSEINFDWCFFDVTYCEIITLTNTTNTLTTVVPEVPTILASSLTVSPKTVCIQANSSAKVSVFLTPQRGLDATFQCSIMMSVRGYKAPISVSLRAMLTERGFRLNTNALHYGTKTLCEEVIQTLEVENLSDLPQTIGFLTLPENVNIIPYAVTTLLPKEVIQLKIGVRPPTLGQFTHVINIINEYDDTQSIQLTGFGYESTVQFSRPCIDLPACPLGGESRYSTTLQNKGSVDYEYVIVSPHKALTVSPSFGTLRQGEDRPIVVFFNAVTHTCAPIVEEPVTRPTGRRGTKKTKDKECTVPIEGSMENEESCFNELYKSWECNSPGEIWSRRSTFLLKCILGHAAKEHVVMLQVNCVVVKPTLVARVISRISQNPCPKKTAKHNPKKNERRIPTEHSLTLETSSSAVRQCVDFGTVPLKCRTERVLVLIYNGGGTVFLQMRPTATYSPFTIPKPPKIAISGGEEYALPLYFTPVECGSFRESVIITSQDSNDVVITLLGSCEPADLFVSVDRELGEHPKTVTLLELDPVQVGQEFRQQLFFHNMSTLPIEVTTKLVAVEGGVLDWPEEHSFAFESDQFIIPGKLKLPKFLIFTPQVAGTFSVCLQISDGLVNHNIIVNGRGCDLPVYFTFPQERLSLEDNVSCIGIQPNAFAAPQGTSVLDPVRLYFVAEQVKHIYVGSVRTGGQFECCVNDWSETFSESGWKLDCMKVTGVAGSKAAFTLSYTPKRENTDVSFCAFSLLIRSPLLLEDNVCYIQCTGST
uniref:Abnormal spindle-like microcephaly-associated protein ASH domain-containing protein n=1 Tax=Trypanosoma congolense (strain IL3000) TaxID=1068625 RepID=G0UYB6_TRYCI|nr:conserved hypothetical protein [Trypanosoma congolense IL3000]